MTERLPRTFTEHELPFERLSPRDFERLCLALVVEEGYINTRHLGASGSDRGVDLAASRNGRRVAFQCKHVRAFGPADAVAAVEKVLTLRSGELPDELILLVTCDVSERARHKAALCAGSMAVDVWALTELDQRARRHPELIAQFFGLPASPLPAAGAVTAPPKLPPHYRERTTYLAKLEQVLLAGIETRLAITGKGVVGVQGMGGLGKSVLAAAAAQRLAPQFPQGVFWVTLGRDADRLTLLRELAATVGVASSDLSSVSQARDRIRERLAGRRVLLILDDVWTLPDAEALDVVSAEGRQILTTRNAGLLACLGAQEICVDVLEPGEALDLLAAWSGQDASRLPAAARQVAEECGRLPLALALAGALARKLGAWEDVLDRLQQADLERLAALLPNYPYPDLLRALEASIEALDAASRQRYLELAVFPEDVAIPEAAIATLWSVAGLGPAQVRELIGNLVDLSLARRDAAGRLTLHDLQRDYLRRQAGDIRTLHQRIVNAYTARFPEDFATGGDDGWFFQRLPWHLREAGQEDELRNLLLSFSWLRAKLAVTGANALATDCDLLPGDPAARQVQAALRLSAHIVSKDPDQLAGQLLGRLNEEDAPGLDRLLGDAKAWRGAPWLRPRSPRLLASGPLLHTIETGKDLKALVTLDEHRIVVASENGLELWDLQTSELLRARKLSAETLAIVDRQTVAARAEDGPIHLWDVDQDILSPIPQRPSARIRSTLAALRTDRLSRWWARRRLRLLAPTKYSYYFDRAKPMVVLRGGRMAIARPDALIEVIEIQSGRRLCILPGDLGPAIALQEVDDRHLASASLPGTVTVWDLVTGSDVGTLEFQPFMVPFEPAIATSAGGALIAAMGGMGYFCVWDWRTGGSLLDEFGFIDAMVWLDERLLATLSRNALRLWDAEQGEVVRIPHAQPGSPVGLVRAGRRFLVSASREGSVRVWDLAQLVDRRLAPPPGEPVADIVFFDDRRAASSAADGTVRIWDVQTGTVLDTFTCPLEEYATLCLSPLGPDRLALSPGRSLRIWTPDGSQDHPLDLGYPPRFLVSTNSGHIAAAQLCTLLVFDPASGVAEKYERQLGDLWDAVIEDLKSTGSRIVWTLVGGQGIFYRDLGAASFEEVPLGMHLRELAPLQDDQIAAVVRDYESDDSLIVVDLQTRKVLRQWGCGSGFITQLAPAGCDRFASLATDSTVRVWDAEAGRLLATFSFDVEPTALAVSPSGKTLLIGDRNGVVHFLDLVEPGS